MLPWKPMNAVSPPHSLKMRLGAAERSMPAACIDVYATLAIAATTERCDVSTIPYHTSWHCVVAMHERGQMNTLSLYAYIFCSGSSNFLSGLPFQDLPPVRRPKLKTQTLYRGTELFNMARSPIRVEPSRFPECVGLPSKSQHL